MKVAVEICLFSAFMTLFLLAIGVSLLLLPKRGHRKRISTIVDNPALCRIIIAGEYLPDDRQNRLTVFGARAIPNQRLMTAFNVQNAFTSANPSVVRGFVKEAARMTNVPQNVWYNISKLARAVVKQFLFEHVTDNIRSTVADKAPENGTVSKTPPLIDPCDVSTLEIRFNLTDFVQVVTLRVVLAVMFDEEDDKLDLDIRNDAAVLRLAKAINETWISSKDSKTIINFESNITLRASLQALFPEADLSFQNAEENPLRLILPAFETLWRIVLRTLIEVRFTTGASRQDWHYLLSEFAGRPTKEMFMESLVYKHKERQLHHHSPRYDQSSPSSPSQFSINELETRRVIEPISAMSLVLEALRLYPPTRRIHRMFRPVGDRSDVEYDVAADIEACHLAEEIWGRDARKFNPSRWDHATDAMRNAYMPFGSGTFACPAKQSFGPWMIALLAGAIINVLGGNWKLDCDDEKERMELQSGKMLRNERNAYDTVFLVRGGRKVEMENIR
jgi:hypothetical protein